jgi:hypothetical protein
MSLGIASAILAKAGKLAREQPTSGSFARLGARVPAGRCRWLVIWPRHPVPPSSRQRIVASERARVGPPCHSAIFLQLHGLVLDRLRSG